MLISSVFHSTYLRADDIPAGRDAAVQIDRVDLEYVDGQTADPKPVAYFAGKNRGLVLNKTNASTIAAGYGDETDAWAGRPLVIFTTSTSFQGRQVPCLRVRIPSQAPPVPPATTRPAQTDPGHIAGVGQAEAAAQQQMPPIGDDDIPF